MRLLILLATLLIVSALVLALIGVQGRAARRRANSDRWVVRRVPGPEAVTFELRRGDVGVPIGSVRLDDPDYGGALLQMQDDAETQMYERNSAEDRMPRT